MRIHTRVIMRMTLESEIAMPRQATPGTSKQSTNVSIRSDLVAAARAAGINLSATLERALTQELAALQRKKWLEDNREAIAAYNAYVENHGAFSDDVRSF